MFIVPASDLTFSLIETFISPYEFKCVTLVSHIRKKDQNIFIAAKNELIHSTDDIAGIFYFDKTLLHCFPQFSSWKDDFEQNFINFYKEKIQKDSSKTIKCINGESSVNELLLTYFKNQNLGEYQTEPYQTNHYKLMILGDELIEPPEKLSCDDEIRRCYDSDFDDLFDLQKKYISKEVAPVGKQVTDLECSISLKQILKNQLCFALYSDETVVSKANTNAIGFNWVQIGGVFTHPLYRKNYYAWNLVYSICQRVLKTQRKVCLFVKEKNNPAHELYKKMGFIEQCDFEICYF